MSNQHFQFKQFRIDQEDCAMKVTTDACILGAWTPVPAGVERILDIGTGTGLLALMVAQKATDATIDAIELDVDAAVQARHNVAASPWIDRINIIDGNVKEYSPDYKYDLIISNPPFFNNSLLSDKDNKNTARHTLSLSYNDLLRAIDKLLTEAGSATVLLPTEEWKIWEQLATASGWSVTDKLYIRHLPNAPVKRIIGSIKRRKEVNGHPEYLDIYSAPGNYSAEFTQLLLPYYLNL